MTNNDKVPELTNGEFEEFVKEGVVVIDFFADWCMPCMMMAPIVDELSEKFQGKIKFGKVDVSENAEIADKFEVSSIPNFTIFKDGKMIDQVIGSVPAEELEERINSHL